MQLLDTIRMMQLHFGRECPIQIGAAQPGFMTHPSDATRIANIKR
jgi:hypothetical protein